MAQNLLTIDPGIGSTGWAYWDTSSLEPRATGIIKTSPAVWSLHAKAQGVSLVHDVLSVNRKRRSMQIFCEFPSFFAGNSGGMAASQSGSIQKLAYLVGVYSAMMTAEFPTSVFTPILVRDWKGQLPKEVVIRRIKSILGEHACKQFQKDIWDAVGIGLAIKGVFK